ncbi:MAG: hypothetical protein AAGA37_13665 [Actinomycetota bacterium]
METSRIVELSWDPNTAVTSQNALERLSSVGFVFDREIGFAPFFRAEFALVWVTMSVNAPSSPVLTIRGESRIDGNAVRWAPTGDDLKVIADVLEKQPAFFHIRLRCDYLMDDKQQAPSGSLAPFFGVPGPVAPGGTAEAMLIALNRQVPRTFLRRPFASTSDKPVSVGFTPVGSELVIPDLSGTVERIVNRGS